MELLHDAAVQLVEPSSAPKPVKENKQLYRNSKLTDSIVESVLQDLEGDGKAFHNTQRPNLAIEHEKPQHRLVLILKLKGLNNREIAQHMDLSEAWVSQICRQPWFQVQMIEKLSEVSEQVVDELVKVEAANSIYKLIELRDTAKSEQVQMSSALAIIERHLGKPIQRVESNNTTTVKHVTGKLDKIDEEYARLEEEERKLLGAHATRAQ